MANNYINMWNNFASKIDPNILRQRIFEEAERINNTFREPITNIKTGVNQALDTIYPKAKSFVRGNYGTVKVTNPQVLGEQFVQTAPATVAKQGISKAPLIGAGITGGLGLLGATANWNKPGSDWRTRLLDTVGALGLASATGLGIAGGTALGHPHLGGTIGTGLGSILGNKNLQTAEQIREANLPYDEINKREFEKRYNELKQLETSGDLPQGSADRYKLAFEGKLQPTSRAIENQLDDTSAQDWLNQIMLDGQNYIVPDINYNKLSNNRLPQPPQSATTNDNISLGINYPSQYLTGVNGAPTSAYNVPSSLDVLAEILGYGKQTTNVPSDNRDFTQRIYDRVDELRDEEDKPELRPKAEIDNIPQGVANEQQPTANDIMLQRLAQLNQYIGQQPRYKDYDPIQRMWIAKAGGMTPYQVWGDYPNQNTRLKTLYDILGKEYEIRKDMEDRARLEDFRKKVILNYQGDPELQMIASDPDLYKAYVQYGGLKDRLNYPLEMNKKEYDRVTDLFKTALTGQNTLANTALQKRLGLNEIDYKTIGQLLNTMAKAQTPDINKIYGYDTQRDIASANNQLRADIANLNAQTRLAVKAMIDSKNPTWSQVGTLINSGYMPEEDARYLIGEFMKEFREGQSQGTSKPVNTLPKVNNGIGNLFK